MWWVSSEPGDGSRLGATLRQVLRYAAVIPIVAFTAGIAEVFYRLTGSDRLSSIFIGGVLLAAFLLGSGPAYAASALGFLAYFFMVDPRFQFTFGSAEDFNVLMMFLAVSGLAGLLTGRMRDEAARSLTRQRINAVLLDATQEFSASSDEAFIRARLAHHVTRAARGRAGVRDEGATYCAPDAKAERDLEAALDAADAGERGAWRGGAWGLRGLRAGEAGLGVVAWQADNGRVSDEEVTLLDILVDTGAAAIARARLAAAKADAETRARTEDLRNALLSSISHDLRTPLAAILASASSLDAFGETFDAATRRDLAATISEEARRLDLFVANLLNMTRLEAGALQIHKAPFNVAEAVRRVVDRHAIASRRTPAVTLESGLPEALGDPVLFEQALGNVVENGLRYSPADTVLAITATQQDGYVEIQVRDAGPGVGESELQRMFEKFYRGASARETSGTGLGLSIARGLVEAMDGGISARNRGDGAHGLDVSLRLEAAA